jgi:hypothetical protein
MRIDIVTLFPEMFTSFLDGSLLGAARRANTTTTLADAMRQAEEAMARRPSPDEMFKTLRGWCQDSVARKKAAVSSMGASSPTRSAHAKSAGSDALRGTMAGMTPAVLIFNGRWLRSACIMPRCVARFGY